MRLHLGEKQAEAIQAYQNLSLVAGQIFGSDKDSKKDDNVHVPQTAQELESAFNSVFGKN